MNQKIEKHLTTLKTFGKFGPPYRKAFGIQPRKSTTISLCTQVLRREIPTSHLCLLVLLHYLHQRIIPYDTKQAVSKVPKEKSFSKSQKKNFYPDLASHSRQKSRKVEKKAHIAAQLAAAARGSFHVFLPAAQHSSGSYRMQQL